ncbi:MAG: dihydrofolate reductase family protein [Burkholderiaceae bacterium]|nr:dihydrofolate reductase family protein [Burkholderiaceae bacterium]
MPRNLAQLYPQQLEMPLRGLYLAHRLHELALPGLPFVYGDFVTSLDGRIALSDGANGESYLPKALTSDSDLRLLLELHAQADCLITNGGYLRAIAQGRLDDILQVGTVPDHQDLAAWRLAHGLQPQPAICIASASLDFPIPESVRRHAQQVLIATAAQADAGRRRDLERQDCEFIVAGSGTYVEGRPLAEALAQRGFRSAFLLAGPRMLETMLRDAILSRLYVTLTHQLLGGEKFRSMVEGAELYPAGRLKLTALYLDSAPSNGTGQLFAQFEPLR